MNGARNEEKPHRIGSIVVVQDDSEMRNRIHRAISGGRLSEVLLSTGSVGLERVCESVDPDERTVLIVPWRQRQIVRDLVGRIGIHADIIYMTSRDDRIQNGANAQETLPIVEYPFDSQQIQEALLKLEQGGNQVRNKDERDRDVLIDLAGRSSVMQQVRELVKQVATSDINVLITGESGTGKEIVAQTVHRLSSRSRAPFVAVNCGVIPENLLESELFGHEKGSFTGADQARVGKFELANGGTLFLDEIGDMNPFMQAKLLRVLQERVFERVGGTRSLHTDVRVICATHRNLDRRVREGRFREDLLYRINVFPIEMPPLRRRIEDIPDLVNVFLCRLAGEHKATNTYTPSAFEYLQNHDWPGNVRELGNIVERLLVMYPDRQIQAMEVGINLHEQNRISEQVANSESSGSNQRAMVDKLGIKQYLITLEKSLIAQALEETGGVTAKAARLLSMQRTTLVEKLRKYDRTGSVAG